MVETAKRDSLSPAGECLDTIVIQCGGEGHEGHGPPHPPFGPILFGTLFGYFRVFRGWVLFDWEMETGVCGG